MHRRRSTPVLTEQCGFDYSQYKYLYGHRTRLCPLSLPSSSETRNTCACPDLPLVFLAGSYPSPHRPIPESHRTAPSRSRKVVSRLLFFPPQAPNDHVFQKCDGGLPHCSRCVRTNRSPSCTYDLPLHARRKLSALQKGEACIPCRSVCYPFFCR